MTLTKRLIAAVVIAGFLATLVVLPQAAEAAGRHYAYGGHRHHGGHHGSNAGYFWGGLAFGTVTGLVVGSLLAPPVYAAPPVVYAPPPVVYAPAPVVYAPVCSNVWVPTYWSGYGWVPGYWTQVCR